MLGTNSIGLTLSGGAARGFAHLGLLKAMEELNIKPDIISGCSAGSIAAAFYADGFSPEEILEILSSYKLKKYFRFGLPRKGLMKSTGLYRIIKSNLRTKNIEDLKIPLWIGITNMNLGIPEYINEGDLAKFILASASIPVVFRPIVIKGIMYVDGGVMDNLPLKPLQGKADIIIASNVSPIVECNTPQSLKRVAERTFLLALHSKIINQTAMYNLLLEPPKMANYGFLELKKAREMFEIGYEFAIEELKKFINSKSSD
ncbi:MAG: patatin [Marinilabiliales bacterium]|nr:MAG: patatin [Marinilabiliales bacterium]